MLKGGHENVDPESSLLIRATKRVPRHVGHGGSEVLPRENGKRYVTPVFLAFVALGAADIAFAVDSIPAAFAISTDSFASGPPTPSR